MSDGNERNVLDESFRQRGKSNEERILELDHDVNGRGGVFAMITELSGTVKKLVDGVDALDKKVDKRMDIFDGELKEVKRLLNEERELRLKKEQAVSDARKPIIGEVLYVLGALLVAAIVGLAGWLLARGGVR